RLDGRPHALDRAPRERRASEPPQAAMSRRGPEHHPIAEHPVDGIERLALFPRRCSGGQRSDALPRKPPVEKSARHAVVPGEEPRLMMLTPVDRVLGAQAVKVGMGIRDEIRIEEAPVGDQRVPSSGRTTALWRPASSSCQRAGATSGTRTNLLAPASMNP